MAFIKQDAGSAGANGKMSKKGSVRVYWSKEGRSGGGSVSSMLGCDPSDIPIAFEPVRAACLRVDISPAPVLVQVHEVIVLGADETVLQVLRHPAEIRRLSTGPSSWWTGAEDATLLILGERNALSIDLPKTGPPAHGVRLRLSLLEKGSVLSFSQAMGDLLTEAGREHESLARQIDSLFGLPRADQRPDTAPGV